ncbi:MAG: hypothetical protein ABIU95_11335 [Burkholderiales bacterium]
MQRALNNLAKSRFFAGLGERALIWDLKQVSAYLHDAKMRTQIRERVAGTIGPDTRVVIGHSLGSVVCYEVLCAHPEWKVKTLVTLGSPLGIANIVFDRLEPKPVAGVGMWPPVDLWFNIADNGDIVALEKRLATRFGAKVRDEPVNNESQAHDVGRYPRRRTELVGAVGTLARGGAASSHPDGRLLDDRSGHIDHGRAADPAYREPRRGLETLRSGDRRVRRRADAMRGPGLGVSYRR